MHVFLHKAHFHDFFLKTPCKVPKGENPRDFLCKWHKILSKPVWTWEGAHWSSHLWRPGPQRPLHTSSIDNGINDIICPAVVISGLPVLSSWEPQLSELHSEASAPKHGMPLPQPYFWVSASNWVECLFSNQDILKNSPGDWVGSNRHLYPPRQTRPHSQCCFLTEEGKGVLGWGKTWHLPWM